MVDNRVNKAKQDQEDGYLGAPEAGPWGLTFDKKMVWGLNRLGLTQ